VQLARERFLSDSDRGRNLLENLRRDALPDGLHLGERRQRGNRRNLGRQRPAIHWSTAIHVETLYRYFYRQ
jgi:hypothetical protein